MANKGRPSKYTKELGDKICSEIMNGKSLRTICKSEEMPAISTVMLWIQNDSKGSFSEQYAKAREIQYQLLADELLDISDDGSNDWITYEGSDEAKEAYKSNGENVQRSRLRVDTRKWMLSKMLPKVYGNKEEEEGKQDLTKVISDLIEKLPS